MNDERDSSHDLPDASDDLLRTLSALASPHRLRVLAALSGERKYVSQLARELGIGRTLLHLHLRRLEEVGLVRGSLELSSDGKAMKFYEVPPFRVELTPATITAAAERMATESSNANVTEDSEKEQT